jgi:putative iron-only hydrogenase system regulator
MNRARYSPEVASLSSDGVGIIGIVCHNRECNAPHLQEALTRHGDIIVGRMGVRSPSAQRGIICLIVEGSETEIQEAASDIGKAEGVTANRMQLVVDPVQVVGQERHH